MLDTEIFENCCNSSTNLQQLIAKGNNILPLFESFAFDIFLSFFKAEITFKDIIGDNPITGIYRQFIREVISSTKYKTLRNQAFLDELRSSVITVQFINNFFEWIKDNDLFSRKTLIDLSDMDKTRQRIEMIYEHLGVIKENLKTVKDKNITDELDKLRNEFEMEANRLESHNSEILSRLSGKMRDNINTLKDSIDSNLTDIDNNIEQLSDDTVIMLDFDRATDDGDLGRKIDLADKLTNSKKLKKLSDMLGKFRDIMNKQLNKNWKRKSEELFSIGIGNDIGHITASEIMKLGNDVLRLEFYKKYVEGQLQQYYLKERTSKGPFIICLDCSSSMSGDKEIWSKAVALTLSEIAGRQRRKCDILAFTSQESSVRHFSIKPGIFRKSPDQTFLELAEYFPGGGTSFEKPLGTALELIRKSKSTNSDIAFITDGEAGLNDSWMNNFMHEKQLLGIKIYSIFIDLKGSRSPELLDSLSDMVTTIDDLSSTSVSNVFSTITN